MTVKWIPLISGALVVLLAGRLACTLPILAMVSEIFLSKRCRNFGFSACA
jgi:hypothetical protein